MKTCIDKQDCICKKYSSIPKECKEELVIRDSGLSVRLNINSSEKAIAVIIDKCLITDNRTKCDAIFLYENRTKRVSSLVELKGFGEIEKAFKQLSKTRERKEYLNIIECFKSGSSYTQEKFFIVTNGKLKRHEKEKLEKEWSIRVNDIITNSAISKIPNLKAYF